MCQEYSKNSKAKSAQIRVLDDVEEVQADRAGPSFAEAPEIQLEKHTETHRNTHLLPRVLTVPWCPAFTPSGQSECRRIQQKALQGLIESFIGLSLDLPSLAFISGHSGSMVSGSVLEAAVSIRRARALHAHGECEARARRPQLHPSSTDRTLRTQRTQLLPMARALGAGAGATEGATAGTRAGVIGPGASSLSSFLAGSWREASGTSKHAQRCVLGSVLSFSALILKWGS